MIPRRHSEPLIDLEAICELPGIDMIFFGPGDFSQGIGTPGKWDNPLIAETHKRIAEVANKKGKFAGTVGGTGNLQDLINMGYQFVSVGADVVGLSGYFKPIMEAFGKSSASQAKGVYKD
jgi:4-hydroxy-2-oxoheptanedioate aldolase